MSELSSAYSEYERVSGLFRQLNEAALVARQTLLGVDPPLPEEQELVRDQLDNALEVLSRSPDAPNGFEVNKGFALTDLVDHAPDDEVEISAADVSDIRRRIQGGLKALTTDDLAVIERISSALDSASERLFRRIQK